MGDLVWTERVDYEVLYHKRPSETCTVAEPSTGPTTVKVSNISEPKTSGKADLSAELESIRGFIKASLDTKAACPVSTQESLLERASRLERSNVSLKKLVEELTNKIGILEKKAGVCSGAGSKTLTKPLQA